ncbi:unnamed protein product [Paramecium primaurelia]|uniref:Uncharacterized protein n=1 Tax=Paramecium primaurelia TaxID=5886 RepID=A0A8S1NM51_PARPR|nr:unnamed protein product [Paramecium primaurelia]
MLSKRFDYFYIFYLKTTKLVIKIDQLQKGMKSFKDQSNRTNAIIKVILKRNFFQSSFIITKCFLGDCIKSSKQIVQKPQEQNLINFSTHSTTPSLIHIDHPTSSELYQNTIDLDLYLFNSFSKRPILLQKC